MSGRGGSLDVETTFWPARSPADATMAARKTARKKRKRKAPRAKVPSFRLPRLSELDQSRRDAVGLGLAGLGALFAFAAGLRLPTGVSAASLIARARGRVTDGAGGVRGRLSHEREQAREDAARNTWYDEPEGEPEVRALHEQDAPVPQPSFAAEDE